MPNLKFKKYIKSWDQYGHPIRIKFNSKGDSHKTFLGGVMSILSYLFLTVYFGFLLFKMVTYDRDASFTTAINNSSGHLNSKVYYKDWKQGMQILFIDKADDWKGLKLTEVQKYIDIDITTKLTNFKVASDHPERNKDI